MLQLRIPIRCAFLREELPLERMHILLSLVHLLVKLDHFFVFVKVTSPDSLNATPVARPLCSECLHHDDFLLALPVLHIFPAVR